MPNTSRMTWPYPSEDQDPWYASFKSLIEAQDASGFAAREDRNLILGGGGTLTWTPTTSTLTWSDVIYIAAPISGFVPRVAAGSIAIEAGQVLYATLVRGPSSNVVLSVAAATQAPNNDTAYVLAIRIGDVLYWRNGAVFYSGSYSGLGSTKDVVTATLVVGNAANGDTLNDCHYLDTGNGAQLEAALAAAGAGADVYVRPGTYDYTLAGGPSGHLLIPAGVKLRGAGRRHVIIKTNSSGDMSAFWLDHYAELEDLSVQVTLPTGASSTSRGFVELSGDRAECRRVAVDFPGVYTVTEANYLNLTAAFFVGESDTYTRVVDCDAGFNDAVPKVLQLTGSGRMSGFEAQKPGASISADFNRCRSFGGDYSYFVGVTSRVNNCEGYTPYRGGVRVEGVDAINSQVTNNHIIMTSPVAPAAGILIDDADRSDVSNNDLTCFGAGPGVHAIAIEDSDYCVVQGNRGSGWTTPIDLDATSDGNVVLGNRLGAVTDAGTGNDVAHNL